MRYSNSSFDPSSPLSVGQAVFIAAELEILSDQEHQLSINFGWKKILALNREDNQLTPDGIREFRHKFWIENYSTTISLIILSEIFLSLLWTARFVADMFPVLWVD